MKTAKATMAAVALAGLVAASSVRAQTCVGDCSNDGTVSISDLVLGVNIALGSQPVSACPSFACQGGDTVPINCLIQGVNNALSDCMGAGPTPTPTPTTGGVTRNFTVDPGLLSAPGESTCADNKACIQNSDCSDNMCPASATGLFTSALTNINAAAAFSSGPFKIVMGPGDANGVHPLTLAEDAVFSIDIVDSSCLCLKFRAAGSTGSIDCDGGTAYDTSTTQPAGPGTTWTFETGLGSPSGPGNANLIVSGVFIRVVDVCSAVHCEDALQSTVENCVTAFWVGSGTDRSLFDKTAISASGKHSRSARTKSVICLQLSCGYSKNARLHDHSGRIRVLRKRYQYVRNLVSCICSNDPLVRDSEQIVTSSLQQIFNLSRRGASPR